MNNHVYFVQSLERAQEILNLSDKFEIRKLLLRLFVIGWVSIANMSLKVLKFFLFKKWGYSKREFKNVVVYTVGILGDNVVMLPALAALRRHFPAAKITVITNCQIWDQEGAIGVLEPSPFKDHLIILDDHPVQRKGFHFQMDHKKFEGVKCDLFVNLSPFGNRGWIGAVIREMIFAKKLGAKYAIGFRMSTYARKGIFNEIQHRFVKNEPRRSGEILKELGLRPVENEDLLTHDEASKESILKKINNDGRDNRPIFVINPGAKFQAKCWPTEHFGSVATWLSEHRDATVIITGNEEERNITDEVVKGTSNGAINLAGRTTIQELVELLRMARGCVTNDTGTMHIAAMVGTPTVAIFSTRLSPTHWFPASQKLITLFSFEDCSLCYRDSCDDIKCLKNISTDKVLSALNDLLSRKFIQDFN